MPRLISDGDDGLYLVVCAGWCTLPYPQVACQDVQLGIVTCAAIPTFWCHLYLEVDLQILLYRRTSLASPAVAVL